MSYVIDYLNGLETIDAAGFPYHGRSVVNYNGSAIASETVEGQPGLPSRAAIRAGHALHHYPIRFSNLQDGWEYCFLYGIESTDIFGRSTGINPGAISATTGDVKLVGFPITVNGKTKQFAVYKNRTAMELDIVEVGAPIGQNTQTLPIDIGPTGDSYFVVQNTSLTDAKLGTVAEILAANTYSVPTVASCVLDFTGNKALIGIEQTYFAQSLAGFSQEWMPTLDGHQYPSSTELGRTLFAVFEVVFNGDFSATASRLYSPQALHGATTRESMDAIHSDGAGGIYWLASTKTKDVILDVTYNQEGDATPTSADIERILDRAVPVVNNRQVLAKNDRAKVTVTRGGDSVTKSARVEVTGSALKTSSILSGIARSLYMDDELIRAVDANSSRIIASVTHTVRGFNASGARFTERGPLPGHEMRCCSMGWFDHERHTVTVVAEELPASQFVLAVTNTRSGSVHISAASLVTLQDGRGYEAGTTLRMAQHIHPSATLSKLGVAVGPESGRLGEWEETGGGFFPSFGTGTISRQFANPVTGALSGGSLTYKTSLINFR